MQCDVDHLSVPLVVARTERGQDTEGKCQACGMVAEARPLKCGRRVAVVKCRHQTGARPKGRIVESRFVGFGAVGSIARETSNDELRHLGK